MKIANYIDFLEYIGELPNDIENCIDNIKNRINKIEKKRISTIEQSVINCN
jgi:hypothetical protein